MSPQEVIEIIKNKIQSDGICVTEHEDEALAFAQRAMEKEIEKKPKNPTGLNQIGACPNCKRFVSRFEQSHGKITIPRCKWCGQALDWGE